MWIKSKLMQKIYHANTNQKKSGAAILISHRADFHKGKLSGLCIMIKGSVFQEDITILKVNVPNNRASN